MFEDWHVTFDVDVATNYVAETGDIDIPQEDPNKESAEKSKQVIRELSFSRGVVKYTIPLTPRRYLHPRRCM